MVCTCTKSKIGKGRGKNSVAEPEPPLLGPLVSRSRFFCWSEPGAEAGAALYKAAPAASFRQAKKALLLCQT